jgi:putative ABC transport system substrate-binding protein
MVEHFKSATQMTPIVGVISDPIARDLSRSIGRPGGNITGVVTDAGLEIWEKRLALLKEVAPKADRVGFLAPKGTIEGPEGRAVREASERMNVALTMGPLESPINQLEYVRVFGVFAQESVRALVVSDAAENATYSGTVVELAAKARLPAIGWLRDFTEDGGLMAYAIDLVDLYGRAAGQVAQILNGTKVGEIPFYRATTFKLIINLKTAKALGLNVPPTLLARADEVIE